MTKPLHIQIIACGGTIDKVYFDASSNYEVGEPQIATIFRQAGVSFEYSIQPLMRKDSLDMTDDDRQLIRHTIEQSDTRHFLITHGTDTMPETAGAVAEIADKTIVLTGSMTPARFQVSDAEFNIGCAVGALLSKSPGVYITMNGCVFDGTKVRKNRELSRFEAIDN